MEHTQSSDTDADESTKHLDSASRLLLLPAELRAQIFAFVFENVRCARPLVVWDGVCVGTSGLKYPTATALLHVCRTIYSEAISILYDHTTIDVCIRADNLNESFPRFQNRLGSIEDCPLLTKLRHVRLQVIYRRDLGTIARVRDRIERLADACSRLKTIDLAFFNQSPRAASRTGFQAPYADMIVKAAMKLKCEKFVDIGRNAMAKPSMDPVHWRALKSRVNGTYNNEIDDVQETFRRLTFSCFGRDSSSEWEDGSG